MSNDENPHEIFLDQSEEDGVGKPMNKAASNVTLHDRKLARIRKNPIDRCINLKT